MNPRVRVFDTATKPVVVVDRWPDVGDYPASEMDGAVVLFFSGEVDVDPSTLAGLVPAVNRVPAGSLRRADVLGGDARQPEDFTARLVDDVPDEQGPEGP